MSPLPEISFVVPCFNEAPNLPGLVREFAPLAASYSLELVLVNNGSTDTSASLIEELARSHAFITEVHLPVNEGYGNGIQRGLLQASGQWLGWAHADLQYPPGYAFSALEPLRKTPGAKAFLKGSRRGRPWLDRFFTWGMAVFETALFGTFLWDISAQPTMMPRSLFLSAGEPPKDFSFDLFYYKRAKDLGYQVVRFEVPVRPRLIGQSSWNTGLRARWKLVRRIMAFSFRFRFSPKRGKLR